MPQIWSESDVDGHHRSPPCPDAGGGFPGVDACKSIEVVPWFARPSCRWMTLGAPLRANFDGVAVAELVRRESPPDSRWARSKGYARDVIRALAAWGSPPGARVTASRPSDPDHAPGLALIHPLGFRRVAERSITSTRWRSSSTGPLRWTASRRSSHRHSNTSHLDSAW
jgi:hypothetical protein